MQALIRRLEVIKNAIALGDEDLIPLQLAKLPASDDARVQAIVEALQTEHYSHAVQLIEEFIQSSSGLVVYEDVAVAGLRLELKRLEEKILELNEDKLITQQKIAEFRSQYHLALGEWIQAVLDYNYKIHYQKNVNKLKQQAVIKAAIAEKEAIVEQIKAKAKTLQAKAFNDDFYFEEMQEAFEELKAEKEVLKAYKEQLSDFEKKLAEDDSYQEYEQAKEDKSQFDEEIEEIIEQHQHELPEAESKRLKRAFRKASKLCHPDTVAEEFKNQAHEYMVALNIAYEKQDVNEVERILSLLESGAGFVAVSDSIVNAEKLKIKITELQKIVAELQLEINELHNDETYVQITALDSWQDYFDSIKSQLKLQVDTLAQQYQTLLQSENIEESSQQLEQRHREREYEYWNSEF